jgi:hypothetical protein
VHEISLRVSRMLCCLPLHPSLPSVHSCPDTLSWSQRISRMTSPWADNPRQVKRKCDRWRKFRAVVMFGQGLLFDTSTQRRRKFLSTFSWRQMGDKANWIWQKMIDYNLFWRNYFATW